MLHAFVFLLIIDKTILTGHSLAVFRFQKEKDCFLLQIAPADRKEKKSEREDNLEWCI
jgi:hypothetical protein